MKIKGGVNLNKNDHFNIDSYQLFSKLITHMPLVFYILDKDWVFLFSDGQGLQNLGLRPGEVVGRSAREMYQEYPETIRALEIAYSGKHYKHEIAINGLFLENYVAPFYNKDGEIEGVIGASIEVTERKLSEIELDKTRILHEALMDSIPGMIYLYNEQGELIFWNKWHETLTGYTKEELYHRALMDWYKGDPDSQQAVIKGLEKATVMGFGEAEANLQCKDGTKIPFYLTACPLTIDGNNYFVGIGVDITPRVEAEKKLLLLNRTLEEKVEERTIELQEVNKDLKAANEELMAMNQEMQAMNEELNASNNQLISMQNFLVESEKMAALGGLVAGVAHEVNTPLGIGVTAATHLMDISNELIALNNSKPLTSDDILPYLEDIDKASQIIFKNLNRAAQLIKSFKQLSVDQSTEPKRKFEIGSYIDEVLISLSPSLKKTKIKIITNCPEPIIMNGYPGAIAQIITNLVMNSLKHGYPPDDPGHIHIETTLQDSMIQIIFSDDGLGMEEQTLNRIYEPFFTTNRGGGGTGLGLSIVYSIVTQQYEGSIRCISQLGQGTTFKINIKGDMG